MTITSFYIEVKSLTYCNSSFNILKRCVSPFEVLQQRIFHFKAENTQFLKTSKNETLLETILANKIRFPFQMFCFDTVVAIPLLQRNIAIKTCDSIIYSRVEKSILNQISRFLNKLLRPIFKGLFPVDIIHFRWMCGFKGEQARTINICFHIHQDYEAWV